MKRRAVYRKRMRSALIVLMMLAAFFSGFFGHTLLSARAAEKGGKEQNRYYTSIQLKPGDNLWDLARVYSAGTGYTTAEYVRELKRMNGLSSDQIRSGDYITIVYFDEKEEE